LKKSYFAKQYRSTESLCSAAEKKQRHIGNLRLISMLGAVIGSGIWWKNNSTLGAIITILGLGAFLALVNYDHKLTQKLSLLEAQKDVLKRYIDRFDNTWQEFSDTGEEYFNKNFTNGVDLDIFGQYSLFQYINIAHTIHGRDALVAALKGQRIDKLAQRQEAVAELMQDIQGAIELESAAQKAIGPKLSKREYINKFLQNITQPPKEQTIRDALSIVLPITTVIAIIGAAMGMLSFNGALILIALQLFLSLNSGAEVKDKLDMLYEMYKPLAAYDQLARIITAKKYNSPYLQSLADKLKKQGGAQEGLRSLSRISGMLKMQNSLLYLPLCGLFMWNHHCLRLFDKWCIKYGAQAQGWLNAIGEFEALYSLAMPGFVKETHCLPQIIKSDIPYIKIKQAAHPLLPESRAVANSFEMNGGLAVITGSNMSGKTTFLRTIGVNLTLAYAGGVVCAEEFEAAEMQLMTSMRISDDVSKGISTFYGELLRVKGMVEFAKTKRPLLALIDEIFKGTNSADRIIGAKATLKTLNKPWVLTLVSTHDFELCDLAQEKGVNGANYHFEEHYIDGKLSFDYTIKPNRCQTSNAQALIRMVGILDEENDL